jgi:preprotein translocase subunit SecE
VVNTRCIKKLVKGDTDLRLVNFLKNVVKEMKVVTWPNAHETRRDTSTVLGTSIIMAIFLGCIDWIVQWGLSFLA